METSIERWTCDHCKKSQESDGTIYFGGSPDFANWLVVNRCVKPAHSYSFLKETLHFCDAACLRKFFEEKA